MIYYNITDNGNKEIFTISITYQYRQQHFHLERRRHREPIHQPYFH